MCFQISQNYSYGTNDSDWHCCIVRCRNVKENVARFGGLPVGEQKKTSEKKWSIWGHLLCKVGFRGQYVISGHRVPTTTVSI